MAKAAQFFDLFDVMKLVRGRAELRCELAPVDFVFDETMTVLEPSKNNTFGRIVQTKIETDHGPTGKTHRVNLAGDNLRIAEVPHDTSGIVFHIDRVPQFFLPLEMKKGDSVTVKFPNSLITVTISDKSNAKLVTPKPVEEPVPEEKPKAKRKKKAE